VPVTWEELRATLKPETFTVLTVPRRLQRLSRDPWTGYWKSRQKLTAERIKAVRHLATTKAK
jgi:bifunctional non-homologous end joining protein LigD